MFSTIVVWPQENEDIRNPTLEEAEVLIRKATEISPNFESELYWTYSAAQNSVTAIRTWETQEAAQMWVEYVLANFNVTSAVVHLES